jgi:hypothetical protein
MQARRRVFICIDMLRRDVHEQAAFWRRDRQRAGQSAAFSFAVLKLQRFAVLHQVRQRQSTILYYRCQSLSRALVNNPEAFHLLQIQHNPPRNPLHHDAPSRTRTEAHATVGHSSCAVARADAYMRLSSRCGGRDVSGRRERARTRSARRVRSADLHRLRRERVRVRGSVAYGRGRVRG